MLGNPQHGQRKSVMGNARTNYADALRPTRAGKSPRRTPVVRLGVTEAEQRLLLAPGPASYSPRHELRSDLRASAAFSMTDRRPPPRFGQGDAGPGPAYPAKSSIGPAVVSSQSSSPRYRFGTEARLPQKGAASRLVAQTLASPGPGAYSPRGTYHGAELMRSGCSSMQPHASSGRSPRTRDRSLAVNTCGPGPAAYSPRGNTLSGPKYTMSMKHDTEKDMSVGPGPANYIPAADRFGTATIGDAPSYSLTSRNKGKRYISREHAKTDGQGVHSPAPDTYLPLEQMGITNTTVRAQFLSAQFGAQFSDALRPATGVEHVDARAHLLLRHGEARLPEGGRDHAARRRARDGRRRARGGRRARGRLAAEAGVLSNCGVQRGSKI